jgi:ribonuclease P protein component
MTSRFFAAFCLRRNVEPEQPSRIGFTIPRAVGKAVVRNRIRRRMREAASQHLPDLASNWAIVFNPRRSALDAPFEELCRETGRIIQRCNERS